MTDAALAVPALGWRALLIDAALAAGLVALLALPFIGVHTEIAVGGLEVLTRWPVYAATVALGFLGRLGWRVSEAGAPLPALILGLLIAGAPWVAPLPEGFFAFACLTVGAVLAVRAGYLLASASRAAPEFRRGAAQIAGHLPDRQRTVFWLSVILIVFAVLLPFLPFADRRIMDLAILVLLYLLLGWGLNIVVGLAGLLDLGFVAFYAIGAYAYALLALYYDLSFWAALPLAGLLAAAGGFLLGLPVLRLRGDYFAIVTLGFGEIIRLVLINWTEFTRGADGIRSIPRPSFFGLAEFTRRPEEGERAFHAMFGLEFSTLHRIVFLYYIVLALALLVNFFTLRLKQLPIGRAWEAHRDDEIALQALGVNRVAIKLAAFMLSAMWGGFAGAFFATRQGFISPESFTFIESAIILAIVVLGGMGSQLGIVLAALLLVGLPELFRELADYRMLAFGAGMVLIMIWRPRGLLARRDPSVRLGARGQQA